VNNPKPVIGILGAGKLGTVLAQLFVKAGYHIYIAGSGDVSKIALSIKIITPGAEAATAQDAIARADIVILALPLGKYRNLSAKLLEGKLVIDAMNYWWEVDGNMPELQSASSSSEMVQSYLKGSRVVKALSHMGYHNLFDDTRPPGAVDRKAIAIAGDNTADNMLVSKLIADLGFDPVIIGGIHAGKFLEPGSPMFGASVTAKKVQNLLPIAKSN
jgi:predicted dinucleotide-binding enzyme